MRSSSILCARQAAVAALLTAPIPTPFPAPISQRPPPLSPSAPLIPTPMRGTFIDRKPAWALFNKNHAVKSFRHRVITSTDVSHRPLQFHLSEETSSKQQQQQKEEAQKPTAEAPVGYGEQLDEVTARWAAKFYGQVTFGPRNYPYPSSRWLARRFKMKKHKIIKRFRFRRYKLAAVANLPFAKMIRVGMLPELKSSKTKKGDALDAELTGQLVTAVRSAGGKQKGHRGRPKSKYQV
ncbi:uncharacterized protein TM35_000211500 [Trypanosoma theileri]|uniref:Uncharacterized protein n=1 Tax=Trypanosoma theileri TaxID=67003 RepID=A0A1X0NS69_9TRYP|nr:uncharacterized protein TM35_000211500 [Trypanosoma theileri]ORC87544.1 hypothetical protein TM35_000211500 [Trypanosoma theileri]